MPFGALSFITFLPLAGALSLLAAPAADKKIARLIALMSSAGALAASLWLWAQFDVKVADFQFVEKVPWIPSWGATYFLGVDGLSLPLVVLTTLLTFIAVIASLSIENRLREYFFFFLLLESAMVGVFLALDLLLFYVFWELTLIPMYFLIGIWGGPKREFASLKFLLFTLVGSLFMLVSILAVYFHGSPPTFDLTELIKQTGSMSRLFGLLVFAGFFLGFAVKIPTFPFHTWLPLAHVEAPTAVSVILAGVLLKMGTYGLLRFGFTLFPAAVQETSLVLAVMAMINIVYGAFCSLAQTDMKRMIAYSSINHMGYVLLGMAALNPVGLNGALLQMVSHGIITGSLFLLVGVLYDRAHTREIHVFGGLGAVVPQYTGFMMLASFASMGLPLLAGFVSEFSCFLGAFQVKALRGIALASLSGVLLTAVFFLVMIRRVFFGPLNEKWKTMPDLTTQERFALIPLAVLTVVLGVHPALLLRPASETLTHLAELARQVVR